MARKEKAANLDGVEVDLSDLEGVIIVAKPDYPKKTAVLAEGYYVDVESGRRVIETPDEPDQSIPHLPYEVMIDPAGNVCSFPVSTNRNPAAFDRNYQAKRKAEALRKGWLEVQMSQCEEVPSHDGHKRVRIIDKELLDQIELRRKKAKKAGQAYQPTRKDAEALKEIAAQAGAAMGASLDKFLERKNKAAAKAGE